MAWAAGMTEPQLPYSRMRVAISAPVRRPRNTTRGKRGDGPKPTPSVQLAVGIGNQCVSVRRTHFERVFAQDVGGDRIANTTDFLRLESAQISHGDLARIDDINVARTHRAVRNDLEVAEVRRIHVR